MVWQVPKYKVFYLASGIIYIVENNEEQYLPRQSAISIIKLIEPSVRTFRAKKLANNSNAVILT